MRAIVLAIWLASVLPACGGSMPALRKANVPALVDGLSTELDRAGAMLDMACGVSAHPKCAKAQDAMVKARAAVAEARERGDRFYYAADRVADALDAVAALR